MFGKRKKAYVGRQVGKGLVERREDGEVDCMEFCSRKEYEFHCKWKGNTVKC